MFGDYSEGLVFLLMHSFYTTAEPAWDRSLTCFLGSIVMWATGLKVKFPVQSAQFLACPNFYFLPAFFRLWPRRYLLGSILLGGLG